MTLSLRPAQLWRHAALGLGQAVGSAPRWRKLSHDIPAGTRVPEDFFGINIATNNDPACDDYVVNALHDLQIRQVRLSYSYESFGGAAERLLQRVLDEGFDVLLDLLPPAADAASMANSVQARDRWQAFVQQTLDQYGSRVSAVEIGNTPNRGRWAGYSATSYLATWCVAAEQASAHQPALAGPNVSDFEPIYNVGFLRAMQQLHSVPKIHTDNLFVERVVQPEAFDHRVAGRLATNWLRLNLVKKARVLVDISRTFGSERTYCTYTCWTRKRLSRWSVTPEQKNADYLMRYLVITAASGTLDRVYWGPLICQRDGLVACGNHDYPKIDNVSYHREVRGRVDQFEATAAYHAMGFCVRLLRNATCEQAHTDNQGLHHFVFSGVNPDGDKAEWHVMWCMDGQLFELADLYQDRPLDEAVGYTADGGQLAQLPMWVSEQPLSICWSVAMEPSSIRPAVATMQHLAQTRLRDVVHWPQADWHIHQFAQTQWRGVFVSASAGPCEIAPAQMPKFLANQEETRVLRDKRNRLWNIRVPWWSVGEQTVKLNRARGLKRISYRFLPSKGKRHWNNATQMLRLGVNTPQPLGFFEQTHSNAADSYYVCQFVDEAFSCRALFTAFSQGQAEYSGIDKKRWLVAIAEYVAKMHLAGVIHRDLSSGNLMMTCTDGHIRFYLIDIGRALIDKRKAGKARFCFKDLNRICYKLNWADRESFILAYYGDNPRAMPGWWRQSLASYDWKQNAKKFLKGQKRSR